MKRRRDDFQAHHLWMFPELGEVSARHGEKSKLGSLKGRWGQSPGIATMQGIGEQAVEGPSFQRPLEDSWPQRARLQHPLQLCLQ